MGTSLSPEEKAWYRAHPGCGFILFRRNVETPDQVKNLVSELKATTDFPQLIMIDQEGGRVRRLRPPHWPAYPPASYFAALGFPSIETQSLIRQTTRLMAHDLSELGINLDCAPVLDVPHEGAHDIIGDRAYGRSVEEVSLYGRAACEGFLAGGILPCIKHIPGHGRALADSHVELPRVTASRAQLLKDASPFMACSDMPVAMTAHVLYENIDKDNCATQSKKLIKMIREDLGFRGLLVCDDLSMQALSGSVFARTEKTIKAGCDLVMYCNGTLDEQLEMYEAAPKLSGSTYRRFQSALDRIVLKHEPSDLGALRLNLEKVILGMEEGVTDPTEILARQKGLA
jgi:beta-N-acetylhexosaminidase